EGLWSDEAHTFACARLPAAELIRSTAEDNHAPAYFMLIKPVLSALGSSERALRLPSALFGVLTVWLLYVAGRSLVTTRVGLQAAFLFAVSPMAVHYSQEARNYSLLMVLVTLAFMLGSKLSDQHPKRHIIFAEVGLFLAILYTHNIGPFLIAGLTVACLFTSTISKPRLVAWATIAALTTVGYLPWLRSVLSQLGRINSSYAWARSSWDAEFPWQIPRSLAAMTHGSLAPIRNHVVDLLPISWIALLVAMTLVVAGFVICHKFNSPRIQLRLTLAIVIPLLGLWSYCWLSNNAIYVVGRTGCAVLPLFLLAIAAGSEALRPRLQPLVAIAFAGMAVLPLETHYRFDFKSQERMLTEVILAHRAPSEPIIGTYFHWGLLYYLDLYDSDDYMAFPLEEAEHPGWFDCATADTLVLTLDADDLATQA
ncbi:MAG: hypothetical protein GY906_35500, partial [bacterium]|nr:hypothetical protein [bacterium]